MDSHSEDTLCGLLKTAIAKFSEVSGMGSAIARVSGRTSPQRLESAGSICGPVGDSVLHGVTAGTGSAIPCQYRCDALVLQYLNRVRWGGSIEPPTVFFEWQIGND